MKKLISFFAVLMLLSMNVSAQLIHTKTVKETVTGGVTRTNIQKFYGDHALNINLITADLKNEHISLSLLKNAGGSDKVDTVMNLSKTEPGVVAATNADFFSYYKGSQNFSLGIEVKDGKLLQSHINSDMAAGFFDGTSLDFTYLDFKGTVTAPNGKSSALAHINKPTDYYGSVLMYTPAFNGGTSPFLPSGITAVTVTDDVVSAKGISLGGTIPIPENGYILAIDDNMTPFLEYNFNIGDKVGINLSAASLIESTETAFGGGTLLLKDGQKTKITHNVSGNNPRTAIGTNADGTVVYLLTVDGRQTVSRGVSLDELADICLEAGMVNAMNFDGGGSTAMVAKTLSNEEIHYINSPSEKRKVINAVAITSDAQKGETAGLIAGTASGNVLSGDSVKLHYTPYDANYNKPNSTPYGYEWRVKEGQGYVKNDVYYAEGSGKTVIELYYNGTVTDTVTLNVINDICGINAPAALSLKKGESTQISGITVFDSQGNTAPVNNISLLNPIYDTSLAKVSGNSITALREGSGNLILFAGNAKTGIKLTCGNYEAESISMTTADPLFRESGGGFSFNVMGFSGADTVFERLMFKQGVEKIKTGDASAVVGHPLLSDLVGNAKPITAQGYAENNYSNAKIISLDLNDSGVLARGNQWTKLDSALKGASQKNIIVLLDKDPGFDGSLDKDAFYKMLENTAKTKNVFVVYNGDKNFASIKNGVRYITVADPKDEGSIKSTMDNFKYLSFDITENSITYSFKNLK